MSTTVIHIPYPLTDEANIAPQVRPRRMIDAFESIGHTTTVISGSARTRRRQMRQIANAVRRGEQRVDLVYSESSGWPDAFSEGNKLSFHPGLDARFLRKMRASGIPVALFYRDAYHRANGFFAVPPLRRALRRFMSYLATQDLKRYNSYVSCLYLPSLGMRAEIPEYQGRVEALPPGASALDLPAPLLGPQEPVKLLYVGGLGDMYRMHRLFEVVRDTPDVLLTVCTRKADWDSVRASYETYLNSRISVVHRSSEQLAALYAECHVTVLAVEPHPYREFAVPVKMYEYLGAGRPIVATSGTLAGRYVEEHGLGWTVDYDVPRLSEWLAGIKARRSQVSEAAERVRAHRGAESWTARAESVADALL